MNMRLRVRECDARSISVPLKVIFISMKASRYMEHVCSLQTFITSREAMCRSTVWINICTDWVAGIVQRCEIVPL